MGWLRRILDFWNEAKESITPRGGNAPSLKNLIYEIKKLKFSDVPSFLIKEDMETILSRGFERIDTKAGFLNFNVARGKRRDDESSWLIVGMFGRLQERLDSAVGRE